MDKIKDALFKLKSYWNKPPKGYDVSYKEFVNLSLGFGALSFLSIIITYTTIAINIVIMVTYFNLSTGLIMFMSILSSIIILFRSPLLSMIIDNAKNTKEKGKFKPFLLPTALISCLCLGIIPFLSESWNNIVLFSIKLPEIAILDIDKSDNQIGLATVIMFILVQVGQFASTLFTQALTGMEQTVSTVAQERANIGAFRGLICNIPSSLINILIATILVPMYTIREGNELIFDGWAAIDLYRWIFPICAIGAMALIMITIKGVKERVLVNKNYVAKVKFSEGAKILSKNKNFWIITVFNFLVGIRTLSNITNWVQQYSFFTKFSRSLAGFFCTTLLMNALIIGMLLGPTLIRKYGKKMVLLFSSIGFTCFVAIQLLFYKSPWLILGASLFQNIFAGFSFVGGLMVMDILDDIQYKTNKRLEGFWQNYSAFVGTILGFFTLFLSPIFLSFADIGFDEKIEDALINTQKRDGAYFYYTLLGLIGGILSIIPLFFYTLTEDRHKQLVMALKLRVANDNEKAQELANDDILNVYSIVQYQKESGDQFIAEELSLYSNTEEILAKYDETRQKVDLEIKNEAINDFLRNLELEFLRVSVIVKKAVAKANKKSLPINEEETLKDAYLNQRHLKHFIDTELNEYLSFELVEENLEKIYDMYEKITVK